jgi:hypothetical protein
VRLAAFIGYSLLLVALGVFAAALLSARVPRCG